MSTASAVDLTFLGAAVGIGRGLARDALWHDGRCNWLGWTIEVKGTSWAPVCRTFGPDLYGGTAGIALFLALLHEREPDPLIEKALRGALNHALSTTDQVPAETRASLYTGLAGIGYACLVAADALDHDGLRRRALGLYEEAAAVPPVAPMFDLLSGSAGAVAALLDAAERFGRDDFADAALVHADFLIESAERSAAGWSWAGPGGGPHLLGYSHGASGIARALADASAFSGDERYREGALEALRYERSHYSAEHGNWPDLRGGPEQPGYMAAWCHGAPGIGFARLRLRDTLGPEPHLDEDLDAALRTTAATLTPEVPGVNYSLCHGLSGNADLLLAASGALGRPELREEAERVGRSALRIAEEGMPWPCGVQQAGETPGLLLGLAGTGHFLLRLHDPDGTPSVLAL